MITFKYDKQILKIMQARGLDNSVLQGSSIKFELEESLVQFKPVIREDIKSSIISVAQQLSSAKKLIADPLSEPTITCVNSYPSDLRAKCFAATVMESAAFDYTDPESKCRSKPLWYRMYSDTSYGYIDKIRDQKPSLLILSNVTDDSTPQRIETLRDILTYFDKIPRIVVHSGNNPVEFFSKRLYMQLNHAIRIGPQNKIGSLNLDI